MHVGQAAELSAQIAIASIKADFHCSSVVRTALRQELHCPSHRNAAALPLRSIALSGIADCFEAGHKLVIRLDGRLN
jgi:hypothetical protein